MQAARSALFFAAAVAWAKVIFPAASAAMAQGDATPFGAVSCSSNFGDPVALDKQSFHLVAAPPAEISSLEKSKPALSAAPSAAGKFLYETVNLPGGQGSR
jgi:hypothetical protein